MRPLTSSKAKAKEMATPLLSAEPSKQQYQYQFHLTKVNSHATTYTTTESSTIVTADTSSMETSTDDSHYNNDAPHSFSLVSMTSLSPIRTRNTPCKTKPYPTGGTSTVPMTDYASSFTASGSFDQEDDDYSFYYHYLNNSKNSYSKKTALPARHNKDQDKNNKEEDPRQSLLASNHSDHNDGDDDNNDSQNRGPGSYYRGFPVRGSRRSGPVKLLFQHAVASRAMPTTTTTAAAANISSPSSSHHHDHWTPQKHSGAVTSLFKSPTGTSTNVLHFGTNQQRQDQEHTMENTLTMQAAVQEHLDAVTSFFSQARSPSSMMSHEKAMIQTNVGADQAALFPVLCQKVPNHATEMVTPPPKAKPLPPPPERPRKQRTQRNIAMAARPSPQPPEVSEMKVLPPYDDERSELQDFRSDHESLSVFVKHHDEEEEEEQENDFWIRASASLLGFFDQEVEGNPFWQQNKNINVADNDSDDMENDILKFSKTDAKEAGDDKDATDNDPVDFAFFPDTAEMDHVQHCQYYHDEDGNTRPSLFIGPPQKNLSSPSNIRHLPSTPDGFLQDEDGADVDVAYEMLMRQSFMSTITKANNNSNNNYSDHNDQDGHFRGSNPMDDPFGHAVAAPVTRSKNNTVTTISSSDSLANNYHQWRGMTCGTDEQMVIVDDMSDSAPLLTHGEKETTTESYELGFEILLSAGIISNVATGDQSVQSSSAKTLVVSNVTRKKPSYPASSATKQTDTNNGGLKENKDPQMAFSAAAARTGGVGPSDKGNGPKPSFSRSSFMPQRVSVGADDPLPTPAPRLSRLVFRRLAANSNSFSCIQQQQKLIQGPTVLPQRQISKREEAKQRRDSALMIFEPLNQRGSSLNIVDPAKQQGFSQEDNNNKTSRGLARSYSGHVTCRNPSTKTNSSRFIFASEGSDGKVARTKNAPSAKKGACRGDDDGDLDNISTSSGGFGGASFFDRSDKCMLDMKANQGRSAVRSISFSHQSTANIPFAPPRAAVAARRKYSF